MDAEITNQIIPEIPTRRTREMRRACVLEGWKEVEAAILPQNWGLLGFAFLS